jgi:DNA-directed RNA polymerase subunit K/omega
MTEKSQIKNPFELVVLAGARARQLMDGCTPRTQGSEKPARLAAIEVKGGYIAKIANIAKNANIED